MLQKELYISHLKDPRHKQHSQNLFPAVWPSHTIGNAPPVVVFRFYAANSGGSASSNFEAGKIWSWSTLEPEETLPFWSSCIA